MLYTREQLLNGKVCKSNIHAKYCKKCAALFVTHKECEVCGMVYPSANFRNGKVCLSCEQSGEEEEGQFLKKKEHLSERERFLLIQIQKRIESIKLSRESGRYKKAIFLERLKEIEAFSNELLSY